MLKVQDKLMTMLAGLPSKFSACEKVCVSTETLMKEELWGFDFTGFK